MTPNGHDNETYNREWCNERHTNLNIALGELRGAVEDQGKEISGLRLDVQALTTEIRARPAEASGGEVKFYRKLLPWLLAALLGGSTVGAVVRPVAVPATDVGESGGER